MTRLLFLAFVIPLAVAKNLTNSAKCNNFQANFDTKSVIGPWYAVAIVPDQYPLDKEVTCYLVEFSEIEAAGLRWLVNSTLKDTSASERVENITGPVIRQRYHSDKPFDVWSKAVADVNGCFQQVLTMDINNNDIGQAASQEAIMQLHFLDPKDNSGPILLQMLWGKKISAVIYKRYQGVTQYQLKPVLDLMMRTRGPQKTPKICSRLPKLSAPKLT